MRTDGNDSIAHLLYWGGIDSFEGETIRVFLRLLEHTHTFLDVGANTGIYSLIAAVDNPTRRVYAFEPVPRVFECLKRNVALNRVSNLYVDCSAVTDYDGEITLYVPTTILFPTSASTLRGWREGCEAIAVQAVTVDAFVATHAVPKVDLMKIDTEGTEPMVLKGATDTLEDEPMIICEVIHGKTERSLHTLLDDRGYRYFRIAREGLVQQECITGAEIYKDLNYLFITPSRMQEITEKAGCSVFADCFKPREMESMTVPRTCLQRQP